MQEKDLDALRNRQERRKRVTRMKNAIIAIIAGWIVISMVLIICLFVLLFSMKGKLDALETAGVSAEAVVRPDSGSMQESVFLEMETETTEPESEQTEMTEIMAWNPVKPPASGISDEDNIAGEGDVHKVYLTFDDGPSENTAAILDILKSYDIKATFFVTGQEDEAVRPVYQRIVNEGHTLGLHSYSNKYSVLYESKESFEEDYKTLQDFLYEVTGETGKYYRFPGGSSNQISNVPMKNFIHFLNEEGIIYYDWNVSSGDAAATAYTADEMIANVTSDVEKYKTSVVLLHDAQENTATVEMLSSLVDALLEMQAELLPIDEDTSVIQYVRADSVE